MENRIALDELLEATEDGKEKRTPTERQETGLEEPPKALHPALHPWAEI